MSLRTYGLTKKDIDTLALLKDNKNFFDEFYNFSLKYYRKNAVWKFLVNKIIGQKLHLSVSVTYLTYLVVNNYEDEELPYQYLSELIVEIEDYVEELEKLIEKYSKK